MQEPRDARLLDFIESDGEPMGETELHVEQIVYLRGAIDQLARVRRGDDTTHAGSNLIFYWDPEDARRRLTPDVFFARGLPDARRRRRTWKLWVEDRAPELIIEVASRSTYELDLGAKRDVHRDVFRTSEYLVFDPDGGPQEEPSEAPRRGCRDDGSFWERRPRRGSERGSSPADHTEGFMDPGPLVGWRLSGGAYRRAGTSMRFESRVLGARVQVIDGLLRLVDEHGVVVPGEVEQGRQQGLEQGRQQGLEQGRQQGLEQGGRDVVRRLLERRFGPLASEVMVALARLAQADLDLAAEQAATAPSAQAWLELQRLRP